MFEKIKKSFEKLVFFFRAREMPESFAFFSIILVAILLIIVFGVILWFIVPRTKVNISISGPREAEGGKLVIYTVTVKNTGNVILENPELVFNHSLNSLPEKGELIEKIEPAIFRNAIYPKQILTFEFKTRLFGQEGEEVDFKAHLSYQPKGKKEIVNSPVSVFKTKITKMPIDLELDLPTKISVSNEMKTSFKFRIRYLSLTDFNVNNIKLKIDWPEKFTLKDARPKVIEKNQWIVPSLEPGAAGTIDVWGEFPKGQEVGRKMNFNAQLFLLAHGKEILLKKTEKISKTEELVFLFAQKINGKDEYIPNPGEKLHFEIMFKNMKNEPLRDLVLTSIIEGNVLDFFSISAPTGQVSPGDNSISWSKNKVPELGYLRPGEEGKVEFWVQLKNNYIPRDQNELNAIFTNRVILAGFEQEFKIKVNSKVIISQEGYYTDKYKFFQNSGPHPPQVDKTTTYSIIWKIENYYNRLTDVKVTASFPLKQIKVKSLGANMQVTGEYKEESLYPGIPIGFKFEKPLMQGMKSDEVKYLQIILSKEVPHVFTPKTPINGSFGTTTVKAVKELQRMYRDEILIPQGLTEPTGYVDQLTIAKLNALLSRYYHATAAEVSWTLPEIKGGTGVFSEPIINGFQIAITPVFGQKGKVVPLVGEVILTAKDQWTGEVVSAKDTLIDTTLPDDPTSRGDGFVR